MNRKSAGTRKRNVGRVRTLTHAGILLAFLAALATTIRAAAQQAPLQPGPNQVLFAGKIIDNIGPEVQRVAPAAAAKRLLSHALPLYPAASKRTSGALVKLLVAVDDKGSVSSILATDGPEEFLPAASAAVQTWTFRPVPNPSVTPNPHPSPGSIPPVAMVTTIALLFQPAAHGAPAQVVFLPSLIRISGGVLATHNTHKVLPPRPPQEFSGTVALQVLVDAQGQVAAVTATSGPQALRAGCEDAVAQWRYQPYLLNGQPTAVESTAAVKFSRGQPQ